MVYDWEKYKEVIFQRFIKDGWDLPQVMNHLRSEYNFEPKRRSLQVKLSDWGYLKSLHKVKPALSLDRVTELWNQNLSYRKITQQLRQESIEVTEREVTKFCKANGLYNGQGARARSKSIQSDMSQLSPLSFPDGAYSEDESMVLRRTSSASSSGYFYPTSGESRPAKRPNRIKASPLRRRKSEMTLTEAKSILGIDEEQITTLRDTFAAICNDSGIRSKSHTTGKWEGAITQLLHQHPELYKRVLTFPENIERKRRALDTICRNFAKTERLGPKMTQTDAKNALGLNPEEAREAREILSNFLKMGGFADKLAVTPTTDNWKVLMDRWGALHDKIDKAWIEARQDPDGKKQKALAVLSRDVLKRLRDDRPSRQSKKGRFDEMDTPDSNQPLVDNTGQGFYTAEMETQSQQSPLSSFDGAGMEGYAPMKTFGNVAESPYTFQATSSPDTSAMSPYLPVQPAFGNTMFPFHTTQTLTPPMFGFHGNSSMSLPGTSQYQPPPQSPLPRFAHASFTGAPDATQAHGNAPFHAIASGQWNAVDDTPGLLGGPLDGGSDGTMTLGNGHGHFEPHAWSQASMHGTIPAFWPQ
ncbi:uncharacterized protein Triagg1_887 [Trichoderma aggressivum f. europaeum]|uniref:Clr5 domain-containing protein n=1 Tax=Trichoderma aggressivum f. europaeum TaxID=173218 RepID=A0AAE1IJA2_9HYPO|nr:hypothetical protein Triagg1_887 [Trichoderma aggressivum f. europaeum]